jgi:hypothetical protein
LSKDGYGKEEEENKSNHGDKEELVEKSGE